MEYVKLYITNIKVGNYLNIPTKHCNFDNLYTVKEINKLDEYFLVSNGVNNKKLYFKEFTKVNIPKTNIHLNYEKNIITFSYKENLSNNKVFYFKDGKSYFDYIDFVPKKEIELDDFISSLNINVGIQKRCKINRDVYFKLKNDNCGYEYNTITKQIRKIKNINDMIKLIKIKKLNGVK